MNYVRTIFFIVLLGLFGCKTYKPLEVGNPTNLKIEALSANEVDFSIELPIRNPNIYKIKVTKIEGMAFINDKKAGEIQSNETIKLPANSDKIHEFSLKVDYSDILSSGMSFLNIIRSGEVKLSINGELVAKSFLYRKELQFDSQRIVKLAR